MADSKVTRYWNTLFYIARLLEHINSKYLNSLTTKIYQSAPTDLLRTEALRQLKESL